MKSVWEFVPEVEKKRNERVKVSVDFGSFTRRELLADLERPAEIWGGTYHRQSGEVTPERRWYKTERPLTYLR